MRVESATHVWQTMTAHYVGRSLYMSFICKHVFCVLKSCFTVRVYYSGNNYD